MFCCRRWYVAQLGRLRDDLVEIGGGPIGRAAPDERQQVADDVPGAARLAADDLEIPAHHRRVVVLLDQQLDAADDRLQRVVDLVGDAGDQLADGRQPLAVHQLIAKLQLLGDVALDADEVRDRAALRSCSATTVLDAGKVEPSRRRRRSVPRQMPCCPELAAGISSPSAANPRSSGCGKRSSDSSRAREADRAEERVVGVLERAVGAGDQDQIAGLLGGGGRAGAARESARCSCRAGRRAAASAGPGRRPSPCRSAARGTRCPRGRRAAAAAARP